MAGMGHASAAGVMRLSASAFGLVALIVPMHATAEPTGDVLLAVGAGFRHTTAVDLAEIAGSNAYGAGEDQSPGSLSFELGAGMLFPSALELRALAWVGVGGLALAEVERRYFASEPEPIGSSITAGAGGSLRYSPAVGSALCLSVGPAIDIKRLTAASPAGSAHLDLVGLGVDAGARWRVSSVARRVGGHLELIGSVRREIPARLWVGRSGSDRLLTGVGGSSDPIYSVGVSVAWVFSFTDAL